MATCATAFERGDGGSALAQFLCERAELKTVRSSRDRENVLGLHKKDRFDVCDGEWGSAHCVELTCVVVQRSFLLLSPLAEAAIG